MDKLYYDVRCVDASIEAQVEDLNRLDDLYQEIAVERQTVDNYVEYSTDDDSDYGSDDDSVDEIIENNTLGLGDRILKQWNKRKKKLIHDYSLTGWILSPLPDVLNSVINNSQQQARKAMRRVFI